MMILRVFLLVTVAVCLVGCPRPTRLTIHNHSGGDVVVVGVNDSLSVGDKSFLTLKNFSFHRDEIEAEALIIRGHFGESCHQIIFGKNNYSDDELGTYEEAGTLLRIDPSGAVALVPRNADTQTGPMMPSSLLNSAKLPKCNTPFRPG